MPKPIRANQLATAEETAKIIEANQSTMHNVFEATSNNPELFMCKPVLADEAVPTTASGSLETLHNTLHMWSGSRECPYHNMGNFYTAARDTLFFGVHGNVNQLWDYNSRNRDYKVEFDQEDWLQASFVFFDENRKLVKCKVKDCLIPQSLGYTFSVEKQDNAHVHRKYLKRRKTEKSKVRSQTLSLLGIRLKNWESRSNEWGSRSNDRVSVEAEVVRTKLALGPKFQRIA
ncbi:hypothetical protein GIB67_003851 [Kingdonia uniflora]|uniref:Uncharacterized protein n=1 Tax=Kingdonia uniflora TaxID=39325 RepID=A0A7J7NYA6_9MAGN|nr:hypothetical protein GIB67_003851 [Kingdonia uniflora]